MRWVLLLLPLWASCDESDAARRADQAKALGGAYPDGAGGVGLLIDMLDDDDRAVREAASQSLVALGRRGLAELVRYLRSPGDATYPELLGLGEVATKLGASLTLDDLCEPMFADQPATRRAAAAVAILVAAFRSEDREFMIDTLTTVRKDGDSGVTAMASASLAVVGWTVVAGAHPASADDVEDLVQLLGHPALGVIGASAIAMLRPRAEWPDQVADYGYGLAAAGLRESPDLDTLRGHLRKFEKSAPTRAGREPSLGGVLSALRSKGPAAAGAKPELEELLGKVRGFARVDVARTLLTVVPTETGTPARALGDVLLEPSTRSEHASAEALAILAGMGMAARPAVPGLISVLGESEDRDGRKSWIVLHSKRAAASILGHLGAKEAVPALKGVSGHSDARLKYRAATALRRIESN